MLAALEQAWLGRGSCAPNPSVGAVAVREGKIIARAWHRGPGEKHAEQLIFDELGQNATGITLYVTLEPCNHWGKTPPCVSAIIAHNISQVIYGFHDPNPIVAANNTPKILQSAGIKVEYAPLPEISSFYQSYQYWTLTKKPWITVKLAHSLDGKIAKKEGGPCQLSNEACRDFTHQQRAWSDIILTTANTIKKDNPQLNVRIRGREKAKPVAILDSSLQLTHSERVFTTAQHCLLYYDEQAVLKEHFPGCNYLAVPTKNTGLDLLTIIHHLGELGYHDVWVEAGGKLFSALHRENLVQRTYLYITPHVLGENAVPAYLGENLFTRNKKLRWQIKEDNLIACLDWES